MAGVRSATAAAGLVLAMLVCPALSFPRYYNEYPKLAESREPGFEGEGIIVIMQFYCSFSHPHIGLCLKELSMQNAIFVFIKFLFYFIVLYFMYDCILALLLYMCMLQFIIIIIILFISSYLQLRSRLHSNYNNNKCFLYVIYVHIV